MTEDDPGFEVMRAKGAMHIIYVTGAHKNVRFKDLVEHSNISEPTISTRLDELQEADLIERTFFDEMPPRVEYSLTPTGEELYELLSPIFEWAAEAYGTAKTDPVDHDDVAECSR